MPHFFREVRVLREEGKLHKKLITRTRMLFIISAILFSVVAYNLIFRSVDLVVAGVLAFAGFLLGLLVFSRMNVVQWNEEDSVVQTGRMDVLGFTVLGLYIVFEIGLRTFLKDFYPASATPFLLAGIFGTLFGRAVGTVVEIHRVFRSTHA